MTVDIPVLVDDVKAFDDFRMTRCTFYGIEASGAVHDWVADLRERGVPFVLFGLSAVLHRPEAEEPWFSSPGQVDRLFHAVEDTEGLLVETEHLWLPNFLFSGAPAGAEARPDTEPARGAVVRVPEELFRQALRFQRGATGAERFAERCRELAGSSAPFLRPSPEETEVFREWSAAQLRQAREHYRRQKADPELGVLSWRDDEGEVHPG